VHAEAALSEQQQQLFLLRMLVMHAFIHAAIK
jgi:hypothetical protein